MRNLEFEPVVVTGVGDVTPLGLTAGESWNALSKGKSGVVNIPDEMQAEGFDYTAYAPVTGFDQDLVTERTGVTSRGLRKIHRSVQYALVATTEAANGAGITAEGTMKLLPGINPEDVGVSLGTGAGGAMEAVAIYQGLQAGHIGMAENFGFYIDRSSSIPARKIGANGPLRTLVGACSTGNENIIGAIEKILLGRAKVMVAGSTEAPMETKLALAMFDSIKATTKSPSLTDGEPPVDVANYLSRPFDRGRTGFVLGEGAGVVVLESLSHAISRGAEDRILAVIHDYGETSDALLRHGDTGSSEEQQKRSVEQAARGLSEDGMYINAHGTSTPVGDEAEAKSLNSALDMPRIAGISSTKGATGHATGGAGSIEFIFAVPSTKHWGYSPKY